MAVIRRNILQDAHSRDQYVDGVKRLKNEDTGITTGQLNIPGTDAPISTYDLFVLWHHSAMNDVHSRPVFPPWHRYMLILFEQQLQRILGDPQFGLPYWDWAADGDLPAGDQTSSLIWDDNCMGKDGSPVSSGQFTEANGWHVRLAANAANQLTSVNRGLRRSFGTFASSGIRVNNLPNRQQVRTAMRQTRYDSNPWDQTSAGFRNRLEGWQPSSSAPALHNRVHVWVGGDMGPSSSPNDPVFYLNHCNVDRMWSKWLDDHRAVYVPAQTEPASLLGQRIDDMMNALIAPPTTPRDMLDVSEIYSYDTLAVF